MAESGVSSSRGGGGDEGGGGGGGGNTNRSRIASLLFALPRPLPHPELHTCQSSRPSEATPCPLQLACFLPRRTFDGRILLHAASIADRTRILCYSVVQLSLYFFFERKFQSCVIEICRVVCFIFFLSLSTFTRLTSFFFLFFLFSVKMK